MGGILAAGVMTAVRAIGEAVTIIARLHNEMLLLPNVGSQAAQALTELRNIAAGSQTTLATLSERFRAFNQSLIGTSVSITEQSALIKEQDRLLNLLGQHTVTGAMSKLANETGDAVREFDRMTGISDFLIGSLNTVAALVRGVADSIAAINRFLNRETIARTEAFRQSLMSLDLTALQAQLRDVRSQMENASAMREHAGRQAITSQADLNRLREQERLLVERIGQLELDRLNAFIRSMATRAQLTLQLEEERRIAGLSANQREIENRLLQINLQFRQLGVQLSTQELANYRAQLEAIQRLGIAQREMTAQAQNMVSALSGVPVVFGNIFSGSFAGLSSNLNSFTAELTTFHTQAFEDAFGRMDAAMRQSGSTAAEISAMKRQLLMQEQRLTLDTATKVGQALTAVFPKSKAAAIGQAVINTAVGITQALGLPWPFNWIQAAAVAASGAAQIASIRSASPSGGSTPTVGGGGANTGAEAGGTMPQMITIEMEKGQLFSTEQVQGLMALISEEVKNGGALIATRIR